LIQGILRARQAFAELVTLDEAVFPLDRAALTIALEEYPWIDVEEQLRRLDTLAARAEVFAGQSRSCDNLLAALNQALFVQEGLRGNTEDYYDPRNSFINEVLDRKVGIPISISAIYIEVGRRIGMKLEGVGFPGHFLVKHSEANQETLIDPYNGGRIMTMMHCQELLDRIYGGSVTVQPAFLQGMDKKAIVTRMLFNLKGIYYQRDEHQKALSVVERILVLNPGLPSEIRDRGLLYMQTSLFAKALADLESYLGATSAPEDSANIENHIRILRRVVAAEH